MALVEEHATASMAAPDNRSTDRSLCCFDVLVYRQPEVIIVGDVHGCFDEMETLLAKCGYRLGSEKDRERFTVVLAGDLVNKVNRARVARAAPDGCEMRTVNATSNVRTSGSLA